MSVKAFRALVAALLLAHSTQGGAAEPAAGGAPADATASAAGQPNRHTVMCVAEGAKPPDGFAPVLVMSTAGGPAPNLCQCKSDSPFVNMTLSTITGMGAYKVLKFTHETTTADIKRIMAMYEVPPRTIAKTAPRIKTFLTSKAVRRLSVGGVALSAVVFVEEATMGYVKSQIEQTRANLHWAPTMPPELAVKEARGCGALDRFIELEFPRTIEVEMVPAAPEPSPRR
ncbi:hypothetical protein QTI66_31990 [Variovorax sp. J22R133]|uniref:hypothetical protein n=1 Tax=Variovorax brevis TaxID=3053503 RepID=UPI0025769008|nr:hypothetical protein [Variovorax sp. J22R133]MDM0116758.1 hypothetical protein [Variovorax sp. J22R133]